MPADEGISDRLRDLIDSYLEGIIATVEIQELESLLQDDESARRHFALLSQTQTDLSLELAARVAQDRAMHQIAELPSEPLPLRPNPAIASRRSARILVAASLLLGVFIGGGVVGLFASPASGNQKPAALPRSLSLDFREPRSGSLNDLRGIGTGFTHRLPGTGTALLANDLNLKLLPDSGRLEMTATTSDLNTQFHIDQAEFPGIRLSDLGFTGREDFEVAVTVQDIPVMEFVGQFGVFAGTSSEWAVRGGLVSQQKRDLYRQFIVNTRQGRDKNAFFVGIGASGDDMKISLARRGGKFSMTVENHDNATTSMLSNQHPEFLDGRADVVVGIYVCDPRGQKKSTVSFNEFTVSVWP